MEIATFSSKALLLEKTEIVRAKLLAYYYLRQDGISEFTVAQLSDWFVELSFARPNASRLRGKLIAANGFIKGTTGGTYRLSAKALAELDSAFAADFPSRDEVVSAGSVLPDEMVKGVPSYIDRLVKQINSAYEHCIFDGCAVLMRRLVEVLLILSYQKLGIEADIQDANGDYKQLSSIIDNAKGHPVLKLSRSSRQHIDTYRTLGNFSAHKIYYTCSRPDIASDLVEYRAIVQELLVKSGLAK